MPPGDGKVTSKEIETIARWIAAGAKTARAEPESMARASASRSRSVRWWAYQPLKRPDGARPSADPRVRTPIDALLRAAMPAGLAFSPDADKRTGWWSARLFRFARSAPRPRRSTVPRRYSRPMPTKRLIDRLARLATLWRTLGAALARRGRLCR